MSYEETPLFFDCEGAALFGILTRPSVPARLGVVIIVGGPQYRVGSHRQFVHLSRALAQANIASVRFDYRGMGDSEGERIDFENIQSDVRAAIDALLRGEDRVRQVVLWGLCDGAAASALIGADDKRVAGLCLFNPWVRTSGGEAQALIGVYYARRVADGAFWRKLVSGEVDIRGSLLAFLRNFSLARGLSPALRGGTNPESAPLPTRIAHGLTRHSGPTLVVLSENDQTAAEFRIAAAKRGPLAEAVLRSNVVRVDLPAADHTLSRSTWRDEGARLTIEWLRTGFPDAFGQGPLVNIAGGA